MHAFAYGMMKIIDYSKKGDTLLAKNRHNLTGFHMRHPFLFYVSVGGKGVSVGF